MSILLTAINAKYIHSNLAVHSLKAHAKTYQEQIEIAEFTINNQKDSILQELYKKNPDILCFSCYIWNIEYVEWIMSEFNRLRPDVPIWVGGPEVSYEAEEYLKEHPEVTGIMIGEGEQTFSELCEYYLGQSGSSLADIAGIAYRKEDGVVRTVEREPLDMSTIPFAYDTGADFSNRIIYYESSRGCPFSCSYCLSSVDKRLRFRDLELVQQELRFFLEQKVPQIKFVDRTFNCNHAHAMSIWEFIQKNDNGVTNFHFEISADLLNEEELCLLESMRPGLIQLEIGVQSTNEPTIREIFRTMKLDRLKQVVSRILSQGNIHQHLDLIAGLPYEDYETFQRSFDEIYALKPNQLQLGFLKVLKGSYMYRNAKEYELLYHRKAPYEVFSTKWLSYDDVLKIKKVEEMLEVYYNSGQFEVTLKIMELFFENAFSMFYELGSFYEKKDYLSMQHSRMKRCKILLEFLQDYLKEEYPNHCEMFQEALTFDLYYRENCKSRPEWAVNPETLRQMSRKYCEKGKLSHIEPFHYEFPDKQTRTIQQLPMRCEKINWILFHYDDRDPLDHQARIEHVSEEKLWQQNGQ